MGKLGKGLEEPEVNPKTSNKQVKACNIVYCKDLVTKRNMCQQPSGGRPCVWFIQVIVA